MLGFYGVLGPYGVLGQLIRSLLPPVTPTHHRRRTAHLRRGTPTPDRRTTGLAPYTPGPVAPIPGHRRSPPKPPRVTRTRQPPVRIARPRQPTSGIVVTGPPRPPRGMLSGNHHRRLIHRHLAGPGPPPVRPPLHRRPLGRRPCKPPTDRPVPLDRQATRSAPTPLPVTTTPLNAALPSTTPPDPSLLGPHPLGSGLLSTHLLDPDLLCAHLLDAGVLGTTLLGTHLLNAGLLGTSLLSTYLPDAGLLSTHLLTAGLLGIVSAGVVPAGVRAAVGARRTTGGGGVLAQRKENGWLVHGRRGMRRARGAWRDDRRRGVALVVVHLGTLLLTARARRSSRTPQL